MDRWTNRQAELKSWHCLGVHGELVPSKNHLSQELFLPMWKADGPEIPQGPLESSPSHLLSHSSAPPLRHHLPPCLGAPCGVQQVPWGKGPPLPASGLSQGEMTFQSPQTCCQVLNCPQSESYNNRDELLRLCPVLGIFPIPYHGSTESDPYQPLSPLVDCP